MKIVIISDTHGDVSAIRRILINEPDGDIYLHAGDVLLPKEEVNPFAAVRGNCDFSALFPEHLMIKTPRGGLYLTHYPNSDPSFLLQLKEQGVRFFVHGHTHVMEDYTSFGVRNLCPGSISYPEDSNEGTYLCLIVSENEENVIFKKI